MKDIPETFQKNANGTGIQTFTRILEGKMQDGSPVYMYERVKPNHGIFGFEVIIPSVKKARTYKLPHNKTITYTEDLLEYPGAAAFGFRGWFYSTATNAKKKLNELIASDSPLVCIDMADHDPDDIGSNPPAPVAQEPVKRTRTPTLETWSIPDGQFTVTQLAELNKQTYINAHLYVKGQLGKTLKEDGKAEKKEGVRGKRSTLYSRA